MTTVNPLDKLSIQPCSAINHQPNPPPYTNQTNRTKSVHRHALVWQNQQSQFTFTVINCTVQIYNQLGVMINYWYYADSLFAVKMKRAIYRTPARTQWYVFSYWTIISANHILFPMIFKIYDICCQDLYWSLNCCLMSAPTEWFPNN